MKKFLFLLLGSTVVMTAAVPAMAQGGAGEALTRQVLGKSVQGLVGPSAGELIGRQAIGRAITGQAIGAATIQQTLAAASLEIHSALRSYGFYRSNFAWSIIGQQRTRTSTLPPTFHPKLHTTLPQSRAFLKGEPTLTTPQEMADFYLYDLPYLIIEDKDPSYARVFPQAAEFYRKILTTPVEQQVGTKEDVWGRNMSAITGLSMTGTEADVPIILNAAKKFPSDYMDPEWTSLLTAEHLISFGEPGYKAVEDLFNARLAEGKDLSWNWNVINSRMENRLNIPKNRLYPSFGAPLEVRRALIHFNAVNYALSCDVTEKGLLRAYKTMLRNVRRFRSVAPAGESLPAMPATLNRGTEALGPRAGALSRPVAAGNYQVTIPGTGEVIMAPGAQTIEEAREMGAMLRYLQNGIDFTRQSIDELSKELTTLQRRQKWLLINRGWRGVRISSDEDLVQYLNKTAEKNQGLLAQATAAIEEGQSLAQVRDIVYEVKTNTPYHVMLSDTSYIGAPGAKSYWEAWKMQEYMVIASSRQMSRSITSAGEVKQAIEEGKSVQQIGLMVDPRRVREFGVGTPTDVSFMVVDPGTVVFHEPESGRKIWDEKTGEYWYVDNRLQVDEYFSVQSIPAPGAQTVAEVEQMQAFLMKAYKRRSAWSSTENQETGYQAVRDAIKNGGSLSEVRKIYETYF